MFTIWQGCVRVAVTRPEPTRHRYPLQSRLDAQEWKVVEAGFAPLVDARS
jgi:hypothetical protein